MTAAPQVLKILRYLCGHGSASFLLILRQNAALVQEATGAGGAPRPGTRSVGSWGPVVCSVVTAVP